MNAAASFRNHAGVRTGLRGNPPVRRGSSVLPPREVIAPLAVTVLIIAALVVTILGIMARPERPAPEVWSAISVGPSGTLWQIASEHPIEGLSTAETIDVIREQNGLTSSTLHAGQTLVVPGTPDNTLSVAQR